MGKFLKVRNYMAAFNYWVLYCNLSGSYKKSYHEVVEKESAVGDCLVQLFAFLIAIVWIFPIGVFQLFKKVYTKIMCKKIS